ncbi:MAG TPA: amidase [Acidimicrobiales bacterium]|jgi:aspartyl-tRNA(Asn)/glutamyl-tRNA(Gln) amidotransferase subunit A|nr:amidase [Acidimicrobiales bacterium]
MTVDFRRTPLAALAADVAARRVSSRELTQAALDNIAAVDPQLNAFTVVDTDGALAAADAIDDRVARGENVGPLGGVPLAVKDLEHARGLRTSFGSAAHAGDPPAERDSVQVARLRAAGCVVVGKTNAPELGMRGETDNRTFGITRNPWNLDRTPGGSSGGSAAALAAGVVPLATGSDGGGSIRIPSAVTGLSGLKPSYGRVPAGDVEPQGWHLLSCRGPMARRIADVAYALDVVVGPHPYDRHSLPALPPGTLGRAVAEREVPARVAWSPTLDGGETDAEVVAVCEAAVRALEKAGAEIVTIDPVFTEPPGPVVATLVQTYIRRSVAPYRDTPFWGEFDPLVVVATELAAATKDSAVDVVRALDAGHAVNRQLADALDGVDVLLCPATRGQTAVCDNPTTVDELLALFAPLLADATANVDASVFESLLGYLRSVEPLNVPLGTINGAPSVEWYSMTQAANIAGVPAGSVCAGFTDDGMPVGLQVIGRHHDDAGVLAAIGVLEDVVDIDAVAPVGV